MYNIKRFGYNALKYHMEDAFIEQNINPQNAVNNPPIAIFSRKYYNELNEFSHEKKYDFCFIGSINSCYYNRIWVIEFAKKYFTSSSIFINTDNEPSWNLLGSYDYSQRNLGYNPKKQHDNQSKQVQYRIIKDNLFYFETMCQSKFILCPAGDTPWSFRFYETIMCKSIPIVECREHTYRTIEESEIQYRYLLLTDDITNIKYDDLVNENAILFEKYHLLNNSIISNQNKQIKQNVQTNLFRLQFM
jgi:hypothetical protein